MKANRHLLIIREALLLSTLVTGCQNSTEVVCVPQVMSPVGSAVIDNGANQAQCSDVVEWTFQWSRCANASNYQLFVKHPSAVNPVIDLSNIGTASYNYEDGGWIPGAYQEGWQWRVRARVKGKWGQWSEWGIF